MRKVIASIASLSLNINDTIKIELIDSLGNQCSYNGYTINDEYSITNKTLELELLENDSINFNTSYKLTLPTGHSYNFKIPKYHHTKNTPHDLTSLISIGCFEDVIKNTDTNFELESSFLNKLELYFTGESPYFSPNENDLISLFIKYADKVKDNGVTIDIVEKIDIYLSKLGVDK